jgi:uncharacterized membrane protein YfcA
MTTTLLAFFVFAAALIQTLSGFGFALVVMPLAVHLLGIHTAAPLVAMSALTLNIVNVFRYRQSLDFSEIKRLGLLTVLGIPVGVWALGALDEQVVKVGLGVVLAGYALFSLLKPTAARPISRKWAYPAGFIAGALGGAYNTSGPPLILYGSLRQWPHHRFRAVLQAVFLLTASIVVLTHGVVGNITADILHLYLLAVPLLLLGVLGGALLDHRIQPQRLRTLVTVLILALGISLIV